MTYKETLDYIHNINTEFCKLGLERISTLCEKLGHPEKNLKFIHVAGTNGKGSFCAMTASILQNGGYKTGLYSSPSIRTFNEQIKIDGKNITDNELSEIASYIRQFADEMEDKPTEFEFITAIAFEYFYRQKCDIVVLETGLGGRFDSTNIIQNPLLSVITGIAYDHTAFLGDTIEAIATEKAGIIKESSPVLFGGENETAANVIAKYASSKNSAIHYVDYNKLQITKFNLNGTDLNFGSHKNIHIPLLGTYQPRNAAIVLTAIEILKQNGINVSDSAILKGLENVCWHGRFEKLSNDPIIIFDGAHNPQGIEEAVKSIKQYFTNEKVYLLTGVLKDKDYNKIANSLSQIADYAFVLTPDSPRALKSNEYASILEKAGIPSKPFDNFEEAFITAKNTAKKDNKPLICLGSLYLYASLYPYF